MLSFARTKNSGFSFCKKCIKLCILLFYANIYAQIDKIKKFDYIFFTKTLFLNKKLLFAENSPFPKINLNKVK